MNYSIAWLMEIFLNQTITLDLQLYGGAIVSLLTGLAKLQVKYKFTVSSL